MNRKYLYKVYVKFYNYYNDNYNLVGTYINLKNAINIVKYYKKKYKCKIKIKIIKIKGSESNEKYI